MATADTTPTTATTELKPPARSKGEPEVNKYFRAVMKFEASDLHLKVGLSPAMRLAGVLRQMQLPALSESDMERIMFPLADRRGRRASSSR